MGGRVNDAFDAAAASLDAPGEVIVSTLGLQKMLVLEPEQVPRIPRGVRRAKNASIRPGCSIAALKSRS
jgi:hypothetical protein